MQIAKCKWCGRPFQSFGLPFCPKCMQELDEQYKPVRDYLYDNPNATIEEVVAETGVPQRVILFYLRDGRLRMVNASGLLKCEQCGAPIDSGHLCEKCMGKLETRMVQPLQARQNQLREEQRKAELDAEADSRKMYTYKDRK